MIRLARNEYAGTHAVTEGQASISEILACFVTGTSWNDVAGQAHEAKRSILNFFATALGSSADPAVAMALATLAPFSGPRACAIIGRDERLDPLGAAFVNAISANLLDFDDTHLETIIHPAAPVAAAVLALAETLGCSGRDVLTAFILGVDIECRIGSAVSPGHYARGWHITSTCGVFGAAAAACRLMGLPANKIAHALGIAASQSAGLVKTCRVRPRTSASAMRRETESFRHCWRKAVTRPRRVRSRGRSAGRAPWEIRPTSDG